jgi:hypothetical protein
MKPQEKEPKKNFVEFLLEKNLLTKGQAEGLIGEAKNIVEIVEGNSNNRLHEIVLEKNLIPEEEVYQAWAEYQSLPYVDLRLITFDPQALALIPSEAARRNLLIPFNFHPGEVSIAIDHPDPNVINHLKQRTSCSILLHIATRSRILEAI